MIPRPRFLNRLRTALERAPICALLGPRQCGKTTLARELAAENNPAHIFDLESPASTLRIQNPELALGGLQGLIILDEIQLRPDLFPVLRVLADRPNPSARFLILGSASPALMRESAETLAGRVEFVDLHGFELGEVGMEASSKLWLRGGFPRSFLSRNENDSTAWREGFVRTFLQRDLPQFGVRVSEPAMRRFWTMLAHSHGQLWNGSELGRSMGLSDKTVKSYLDTLSETYMVRQLQPWFENVGKRQVKSPKIYLRDSGLLHHLLNIASMEELMSHPKVSASWEGYALEEILRLTEGNPAYFWATQSGAELDLLVHHGGKRLGFEFKYSENPRITKSMRIAIEDLRLNQLTIVCPGKVEAKLDINIEVRGLECTPTALASSE